MIKKFHLSDGISNISYLIDRWISESNQNDFGIECDHTTVLNDILDLINSPEKDLFAMEKDGIVGFMGMRMFKSHLCNDLIACEHFWYVLPEHRGQITPPVDQKGKKA